MEGHVTGTIIADYVSANVYSMVKNTVNRYIEKTGEAGDFIEKVLQFCEDYDMNENDTLLNLNNLGWNPVFGARIIDYGLSNEMIEKFYSKS